MKRVFLFTVMIFFAASAQAQLFDAQINCLRGLHSSPSFQKDGATKEVSILGHEHGARLFDTSAGSHVLVGSKTSAKRLNGIWVFTKQTSYFCPITGEPTQADDETKYANLQLAIPNEKPRITVSAVFENIERPRAFIFTPKEESKPKPIPCTSKLTNDSKKLLTESLVDTIRSLKTESEYLYKGEGEVVQPAPNESLRRRLAPRLNRHFAAQLEKCRSVPGLSDAINAEIEKFPAAGSAATRKAEAAK